MTPLTAGCGVTPIKGAESLERVLLPQVLSAMEPWEYKGSATPEYKGPMRQAAPEYKGSARQAEVFGVSATASSQRSEIACLAPGCLATVSAAPGCLARAFPRDSL